MPAVPYKNYPATPKSRRWDASAAQRRIKSWATSAAETDWGKVRGMAGWYDSEMMESMDGCKLFHHDIVGGSPKMVPKGLYAAMAALNGARAGMMDMPDKDRKPTWEHLAKHYRAMGEEPPELVENSASSITDTADSADTVDSEEIDPEVRADRREFAYWLCRDPIRFQEPSEDGTPDDGRKRSKIQICKGGVYFHPWFDVMRLDRALFVRIVANFETNVVNQEIHVDTDHCKQAPAQGWYERVWTVPGDPRLMPEDDLEAELWGEVRWTDLGAENIEKERYKYTSIEYWGDYKDNQGRAYGPTLTGTALTNIPFLTGMAELTLNRGWDVKSASKDSLSQRARAHRSALTPAEPQRTAAKPETRGRLTMAKLSKAITKVLAGVGFSKSAGAMDEDVAQEFVDRVRAELGLENDETVTDEGIILALNAAFEAMRQDAENTVKTSDPPKFVIDSAPSATAELTMSSSGELSKLITAAVEQATSPLRAEVLTLKSTLESKEATVQELVARSQRIEQERDGDRFETRFSDVVRERKAVPAMRDTLRQIWDTNQELFEKHVATLPTRREFAGPVGHDGVNEETDGVERGTTKYYDEIQRLMREEKLLPRDASRRVRHEHPEWYNEHQILTGHGARELIARRRLAERMLQETRTA